MTPRDIAVGVVAAEAALIALVLALIFVFRFRRVRGEVRRAALAAAWRDRFAAAIGGEATSAAPVAARDEETILLVFTAYHRIVRGPAADALRAFGRRAGIAAAAARELRKRGLRRRIVAASALGFLRDGAEWDELLRLAGDDQPYLSLAASMAMVRIDPTVGAVPVAAQIVRRVEWSVAQVSALLREAGSTRLAELVAAEAARAPGPVRARLLLHLADARSEAGLAVAREVLATDADAESLAAALEVVAEFADPADLAVSRRLIRHDLPSVRARAVAAMSRVAGEADVQAIVALLGDPDWSVRYRAAHTLVSLPCVGTAGADRIAAGLDQPEATDVLRHVLAEASR